MKVTHLQRAQQGATLVLVALWMGIALAAMMVLDIGHLVWQKREIQKIADLSALAGATGDLTQACVRNPGAAAQFAAKENGWRDVATEGLEITAGTWRPNGGNPATFFQASSNPNACHIKVKRTVPYFFMWHTSNEDRTLTAQATAVQPKRVARLSIRSELLNIDSARSILLNAVIGGLLGGRLNISAVGWQGLVGADVELLKFLDILAIRLGLDAGNYESVLGADVGVGQLLEVTLEALQQKGPLANLTLNALEQMIGLGAAASDLKLKLGQLLNLQTGLDSAALDTNLNVFDLIQASIQAANSKNAIALDLTNNELPALAGLLGVSLGLRVIEPPQLSSIGDPYLAQQNPLGDNRIFVRTAQVRVLLSLDLPVITGFVNGLLDFLALVLDLKINLLPQARLDLSLEVGGGSTYVTGYQCGARKQLTTTIRTAVADLKLGRMGNSAAQAASNVLGSTAPISNAPIPLLTLGCQHCLLEVPPNGPRPQYYGGLGLQLDLPVAARTVSPFIYEEPPRLDEAPKWQGIVTQNVIASLGDTLGGVGSLLVNLPAERTNFIASTLKILTDVISGLVNGYVIEGTWGRPDVKVPGLIDVVKGLLSPLLDPILNGLLRLLGINLATTEAGAQLNCGGGAELVY